MKISRACALGGLLAALPGLALAADLDGATLSVLWGVPFAGILLSIALMPLMAPIFWHHHFGKVAAAWSLAFLVPFAIAFGPSMAGASLVHAMLAEYIPFVILLTALFTVAGGIHIRGNLHGSPGLNTAILAIGAVLASFMGTTGASMLLIRPLIRANDNRKHVAHVVIFSSSSCPTRGARSPRWAIRRCSWVSSKALIFSGPSATFFRKPCLW